MTLRAPYVIKITNSRIFGRVNLSKAIIREIVNFECTKFNGPTKFNEAQFNSEYTNFEGCQFNGPADFSNSQFRSRSANFGWCRFNATASFNNSQFIGAYFGGAQFIGVYFRGFQFSGFAYFCGSHFRKFSDFWGSNFNGEDVTFRDAKFNDPKDQEYVCRKAKQLLEKCGNREEAGYHFYREMEAKRRQKSWLYRYLEFVFIQLIFGYGVNPIRLWACWFIFVGVFVAIYSKFGGIGAAQPLDYIWFSITVAVTPGFAGYKPTSGLFQIVAGLVAILGTFMWAAFVTTFARKYMR